MDYRIVSVENSDCVEAAEQLQRKVEHLLKEGWSLQGGVSISASTYDYISTYTLVQAMVK